MNLMRSKEDLACICRLLYNNLGLNAVYAGPDGQPLAFSGSEALAAHPLLNRGQELLELASGQADGSKPHMLSLNELENYIIASVGSAASDRGFLILGPSVYARVSDEAAAGLLNDYSVPAAKREQARGYFAALPAVSGRRLLQAGVLLHYLLTGEELDPLQLLQPAAGVPDEERTELERHVDRSVSAQREATQLHHDHESEKRLFQSIKEGRPDLLAGMAAVLPENVGVLSKSSFLRSQKNLTIAGITLATRAAMEGGLHSEIAYTMSDLYIQRLEELHDIPSVSRLRTEALRAFAERVRQTRAGRYSGKIAECRAFIFNHIYEELPLDRLAAKAGLNPNYLSQLFKKETGMPIQTYIINEKLEEAKKLLAGTELAISEICSRLNFYDQSHFTKMFKKSTGMTPKRYRTCKEL